MTDEIRSMIKTRLAEIEDEAARLERTLEHLSPRRLRGGSADAGAGSRSKRTGRRKGKRAARGERRIQLLDAIKKMPGASPGELADAIGVSSSQAHQMIRTLERKHEIKKKGQGFVVS